jgi:hypothetical protein
VGNWKALGRIVWYELHDLVDETGLFIINHPTEHCYESESCLSDKKIRR